MSAHGDLLCPQSYPSIDFAICPLNVYIDNDFTAGIMSLPFDVTIVDSLYVGRRATLRHCSLLVGVIRSLIAPQRHALDISKIIVNHPVRRWIYERRERMLKSFRDTVRTIIELPSGHLTLPTPRRQGLSATNTKCVGQSFSNYAFLILS